MPKSKLLRWIIGVGVVALLMVWAYGELVYPRTNPPERHSVLTLSERSDAILRRACCDCHCNETRYPWDSRPPIASILMGRHVRKGRAELFPVESDEQRGPGGTNRGNLGIGAEGGDAHLGLFVPSSRGAVEGDRPGVVSTGFASLVGGKPVARGRGGARGRRPLRTGR